MIDERALHDIEPDEVVINGITYRKRPSTVPAFPCWDGGPRGGIVFVNWLNSISRTVDKNNPWKGGGVGCKTFERAALRAAKQRKFEYEQAVRVVEAYEAAKEKAK